MLPDARLCPERLQFLDRFTTNDLKQYNLFSGHFYRDQINCIPAPKIVFTLLREPRLRLLSLYRFFRVHTWEMIAEIEKTGAGSPRKAKENSLCGYLRQRDAEVRFYVDNAITRHLIGRSHFDVNGEFLRSDEEAFQLAIESLRSMNAFFVAEQYSQAVPYLRAILGLELPDVLPRDNRTESLNEAAGFDRPDPVVVDEETAVEIQRCIRIDKRVYDWSIEQGIRALVSR